MISNKWWQATTAAPDKEHLMKHRSSRAAAAVTLGALFAAGCGFAEDPGSETVAAQPSAEPSTGSEEAALKIGAIVPQTGPLAFFGPPLTEAAVLALDEINAAGGVLGQQVAPIEFTDDAGDATIASQSADRLLRSGVHAIVGAAGSGMSLAVIDKITGSGIVQCSPSNTAPTFTDYDDGGFYFRTAPSDALQGPVLAQQMIEGGATKAALVARADDYGQGLINTITPVLEDAGVEVVASTLYDPAATNFDATIEQLGAGAPDAVAVIAFEEGAQLLQGMIEAGLGPHTIKVYGSDGMRSEELAQRVSPDDPSVLQGMRGTAGDPSADPAFIERLQAAAPTLKDTVYAAHTFDCVTVIALAAQAAGSTAPARIAEAMQGVTRGGERCTSYADCIALIEGGTDIDYDGPSGPLEFTDAGEPERTVYEIWEFDASGTLQSIDTRESTSVG